MNRIVPLIIFAMLVLDLYAQLPRFISKDGTQLVYWTDSVYLSDYTVVCSGKNGHRFIIPDENYSPGKKNHKYWNDSTAIFYLDDANTLFFFCSWPGNSPKNEAQWDEIWPWEDDSHKVFYNWPYSKKDQVCKCLLEEKPTFFRVFKIRGDAYNEMTRGIDTGYIPIRFINPENYYLLYIPIR